MLLIIYMQSMVVEETGYERQNTSNIKQRCCNLCWNLHDSDKIH